MGHPGNQRIPRTPCALCGEHVVWVEREEGKKMALNPERVSPQYGSFRRSSNDGPSAVRIVPENERWMHASLYQPHNETCAGIARCKQHGVHRFAECREFLAGKQGLSQSRREDQNPAAYRVDRSQ